MYKNCTNCAAVFNRKGNAKFCSRKCMKAFNAKIDRHCKLCDKVFICQNITASAYCSASCRNRVSGWIKTGKLVEAEIGILCPVCRKGLMHRVNRKAVFCSHSCAAKCKDKIRKSKAMATCHPDKPLVSKGLCQSCWSKKYYSENKTEQLEMARASRLKRDFGITIDQWNAIFDKQCGLCPICDKPILKPNNSEGKRAAAVDHDHKTGRVRGLVHDRCNRFKIAGNTIDSALKLVPYLGSEFDGRNIIGA